MNRNRRAFKLSSILRPLRPLLSHSKHKLTHIDPFKNLKHTAQRTPKLRPLCHRRRSTSLHSKFPQFRSCHRQVSVLAFNSFLKPHKKPVESHRALPNPHALKILPNQLLLQRGRIKERPLESAGSTLTMSEEFPNDPFRRIQLQMLKNAVRENPNEISFGQVEDSKNIFSL